METLVSQIAFWAFSIVAVVAALGVVVNKNAVTSAMCLVTTFVCVAGLFLTLNAGFMAAVQILVYAGAIMVLFLFVIMLLNVDRESFERPRVKTMLGAALAFLFAFGALALLGPKAPEGPGSVRAGTGHDIGVLFTNDYVFAFEMASMLLLIAMVGAIVLARKRRPIDADSGPPEA